MKFTKGMMIRTQNATWYVTEDQTTSKYVSVSSSDGFETIIDINAQNIKIIK